MTAKSTNVRNSAGKLAENIRNTTPVEKLFSIPASIITHAESHMNQFLEKASKSFTDDMKNVISGIDENDIMSDLAGKD